MSEKWGRPGLGSGQVRASGSPDRPGGPGTYRREAVPVFLGELSPEGWGSPNPGQAPASPVGRREGVWGCPSGLPAQV